MLQSLLYMYLYGAYPPFPGEDSRSTTRTRTLELFLKINYTYIDPILHSQGNVVIRTRALLQGLLYLYGPDPPFPGECGNKN